MDRDQGISVMKTLLAAAVLSLFAIAPAHAAEKPQIMIVGVAHLESKRDVHNSTFKDDILGQKMQSRIADVIDRIAKFHPNKVMIEGSFESPKLRGEYAHYLAGTFTLGANENYQYGFRLAKLAGNDMIYPIDDDGPNIVDDNSPEGKAINKVLESQIPLVEKQDPEFGELIAKGNALESAGDILGLLQYLNSDEAIRANASWYAFVDRIGQDVHHAGAAYVGSWYARNAYIFSNIMQETQPGDRVVLFIGQGHEYLLRDFVLLSSDVQYVNALDYLK